MMLDVLFIHPGNQKKTYQDLAKEFTAIATPVWTMLLADHTRRKGYSTAIYDVNVEGWDEQTIDLLVQRYHPRLIVIMVYGHNPSASTQTMPAAGRIASDIKKFNREIPVAMGGIHPSALPQQTLEEESIDFVIQGEGAYTIDGLAAYAKSKKNIKEIPGLWFLGDQGPEFTKPALLIEDLDNELSGYAWDLLPGLDQYRAHNMHSFQDFKNSLTSDFSDVRSPYVVMNTSLGCPYSCHYCCIHAIFGKSGIRYWSLDKVLSWIDQLVMSYHVRNIRFDDELFILTPKRIEEFCDRLIERKYDLNIWVYGRVDTIDASVLEKMKKAGINWICLGIESANEKVRNAVNKKINKDVKSIVRLIQEHQIYVLGNYMFGLPEDNLETMQETLDFAIELNCEFSNFYAVMAYPGSRLYSWAQANGYLPHSWKAYSQHGYETQPLPTRYISSYDVLKFRDEAFLRYHTNPAYTAMIEQRFSAQVRRHIERMSSIQIKRWLCEEQKQT